MGLTFESGAWNSGMGWNSPDFQALKALANESEQMLKSAYTTGEGIVTAGTGATGDASKVRVQFLHDGLEQVSFEMDDAKLFKHMKKEKVYSNTFEWSQILQYGGAGDGFVSETGTGTDPAGNNYFGVSDSSETFARQVLQIKFMAAVRNLSLVSTLVNSVGGNIEKIAEASATKELISKANLALYYGDGRLCNTQFNGMARQMIDYVSLYSQNASADQVILYDAGGQSVDKYLLEEIAMQNKLLYGHINELWQSPQGYADTQKNLFPEARIREGERGTFGVDKRTFTGPYGDIKLYDDPMFRPNHPLVADGPGVTGIPRAVADSGAPVLGSSSVTAAGGSAGTASWWLNITVNQTNPAAAPAVPSGAGNQGNRLAAGTYGYAVAPVYQGKEGLPVYINSVTVTAGQIVTITIPNANVTGISSAMAAGLKFRVYRSAVAASTTATDYALLHETGCSGASGNSVSYDNGMYIPGADAAFALTGQRNGSSGIFLAQLLPLMKRQGLPETVLGTPLAMLLFLAPIVFVPRHHIYIRNIARAS